MKGLHNITRIDRPREKLKVKGAQGLSDFELLQALIGSGNKQANVSTIANNIHKILQKNGVEVTYAQLEQIIGLGEAKITVILSAFELTKRFIEEQERPVLDSPDKVTLQLRDIRDKKQEHFVCITLDGANRMLAKRTISIGTLTASLVHPREVFADAITDRAASIIVAHNHPSGNPTPSSLDHEITMRLRGVGQLLGIKLVDHLVVTKKRCRSVLTHMSIT